MKSNILFSLLAILVSSSMASADCYTAKTARDAVRAIALVSNQSMITDLVGGPLSSGDDADSYQIWANYRHHSYADRYEVSVERKTCRVRLVRLVAAHLPIVEPN
jgi:hypothetical protein